MACPFPPITARRNGVWDRSNIAVLRLVPHPGGFPSSSRPPAISTRCPKQTPYPRNPKNPRKTTVLAASRRLGKGQPRNATLEHHEIYLETRCIKHKQVGSGTLHVESPSHSPLRSNLLTHLPSRLACHLAAANVTVTVIHATKQSSRSVVHLPAYPPTISPLGP